MNSSLLKLFLSYRTGLFSECTIPNTYIVDVAFQSLSHVQPFATKWTATCQAPLSFTISWSLLKFMSTESDSIQPSYPLPAATSLSILPSIRVFSNAMTFCIRRPKYWSFSLSNGPSNEYSGLISFRIDWFNLHAVQGTLKSLLQHHN